MTTRLDKWWERIAPRRRIDRTPSNICLLIGLMFPAAVIVLRGPAPLSAVGLMSENLQISMCSLLFIGCGIKLHGACLGARWYFKLKNNKLQSAYRWGYAGAPAAVAALGVYTYYLIVATHGNIWGAISAFLTPMLGIGIGLNAVVYWLESRRIDQAEQRIIQREYHTDN